MTERDTSANKLATQHNELKFYSPIDEKLSFDIGNGIQQSLCPGKKIKLDFDGFSANCPSHMTLSCQVCQKRERDWDPIRQCIARTQISTKWIGEGWVCNVSLLETCSKQYSIHLTFLIHSCLSLSHLEEETNTKERVLLPEVQIFSAPRCKSQV